MYEVKPEPQLLETNIRDAVFNFFIYGLQPGSYTTLMLQHRFDDAYHHAHPLLKSGPPDEPTTHDCLELSFKELPEFLTGECAKHWPGYVNLNKQQRDKIQQSYTPDRIGEWKTYRTLNNRSTASFAEWIKTAESHRVTQLALKGKSA